MSGTGTGRPTEYDRGVGHGGDTRHGGAGLGKDLTQFLCREDTTGDDDPNDVAIMKAADAIASSAPETIIAIASTDTDFLVSGKYLAPALFGCPVW